MRGCLEIGTPLFFSALGMLILYDIEQRNSFNTRLE